MRWLGTNSKVSKIIVLVGLWAVLSHSLLHSQSATGLLNDEIRVHHARRCFYVGTDIEPFAILSVEQIYTDYQRKGFFRIGALPVEVMEGVKVEVLRRDDVVGTLSQLHRSLNATASRRVELRRVELLGPPPAANRLDCGLARIEVAGKWELSDGVTFISGTNQITYAGATLQMTGPETGRLVLNSSPAIRTLNFFSDNLNSQPANKENSK